MIMVREHRHDSRRKMLAVFVTSRFRFALQHLVLAPEHMMPTPPLISDIDLPALNVNSRLVNARDGRISPSLPHL